jgi:glycogen synthase
MADFLRGLSIGIVNVLGPCYGSQTMIAPTGWSKNTALELSMFPSHYQELASRRRSMQQKHVVFCSFESRFAKSGGLAAVVLNTLPFLKEAGAFTSASLISPFYPMLMDRQQLEATNVGFSVPFGDRHVEATLFKKQTAYSAPVSGTLTEYYIDAPGFFTAQGTLRDPYVYVEDDPAESARALLENALFFSAAVPRALAALDLTSDVVLHLQEWQTTLVALTAKLAMLEGVLRSCALVQTMHNPYDCFVPLEALLRIVSPAGARESVRAAVGNGLTAFQIGLGLIDVPVATVSEHFAEELTTDVMQTRHFAPHLQQLLSGGVAGINNGPFVPFSDRFPKRGGHSIDDVLQIKQRARQSLLSILDTYKPPQRFGALSYRGGPVVSLPDAVPIIVMSGRLDWTQKGYDILLQALERFDVDDIKAVLTPLAIRDADLDFFREVVAARSTAGNIVVYPMRMEKGYVELQTGATFGVMPSIYEPFGAAIEYMANGTVNIGRRSGGLVNQISHGETGFLFRESAEWYTVENVKAFAAASDNVTARRTNPWAVAMVDALTQSLRDATRCYRDRPEEYARMVLRGFDKAQEFSWQKNAAEYSRLYRMASAA